MGRVYTVQLEKGSFGLTASDVVGYQAGMSKMAQLLRWSIDECDSTLVATPYDLDLAMSIFSTTPTLGTGTTSGTPNKTDLGDPSPQGTAYFGPSSTISTVIGTTTKVIVKSCHIYQGIEYVPAKPIPLLSQETIMLQILTALPLAAKLSAMLWIEEIGG